MTNFFKRFFGNKPQTAPLRDVAAMMAPLAVPAIHVDKTASSSLSHFGGSPNLPAGVPWPERNGEKLGFLARLSLSEIHHAHPIAWLPSAGALLFFYDMAEQPWGFDPKDRGCAAILLVPDLPQKAAQVDSGPDGNLSPLPHQNIALRRTEVFPGSERAVVRDIQLSNAELDALVALEEANFRSKPKHQVSGFPSPVQGDEMELECQLVTHGFYCGDSSGYDDPRAAGLKAGAANWKLLLQLDTDDDMGIMWGDVGMLYFWVEEQAARDGNFSNVWVILQCC